MAKYTDLDEALANPQDVEDGRIHHPGATTPREAGISCLVGILFLFTSLFPSIFQLLNSYFLVSITQL